VEALRAEHVHLAGHPETSKTYKTL
jgi:hypothetical protein